MPNKTDDPLRQARAKIIWVLKAKVAKELAYARPLDVHTWSDHPEANAFVDSVYDAHFEGRKSNIKKKHLKVVLLDLYVAWRQDPRLKTFYSRNVNDYKARSRYSALHISKLTIDVVDRLIETGFLVQFDGFYDHDKHEGRQSRIWPTEQLTQMFKDARFGPLDIGGYEDREVIVRRDEHGNNEEYENTEDTDRMREILRPYNELLRSTFIDIPTLDTPYIELARDKLGKQHRLWINQRDKFVRRIFNRGSFEKGGRFWGGWWQRCPKERREGIFMNDEPTSEIDYSGLHIVILYAKRGIDYWTAVGEDPYQVPKPDFVDTDDQTRDIAKQLLLVALNAADENGTFGAFRDGAPTGSMEKRLTNKQLGCILDQLKDKHPPIADNLASDAGIDLTNVDAQITERIIHHFTNNEVPILSLHDSYIVPYGLERHLETLMQEAFKAVTGIEGVKVKDETFQPRNWEPLDLDDALHFDWKAWELDILQRENPPRTDRYKYQLEIFREWREREGEDNQE